MELTLLLISGLLLVISLVFAFVPVVPAVVLAYVGLLVLHFTEQVEFSILFLVVWALVALVLELLDNFLPLMGVKLVGGSKQALRGSLIGVVVGLFLGPLGILIGPFLGAFLGEYLLEKDFQKSLRVAVSTFLGLLVNTALKVVAILGMIFFYVKELWF